MTRDKRPALADVERFLGTQHPGGVGSVEPLRGGFWSSAYAYQAGEDSLVLRLAGDSAGFEMDRMAHQFSRPGLPVPEVLEVGDGLSRSFAISRRAHGRFIEDVRPEEAERSAQTIDRLLGSLRSVEAPAGAGVDWFTSEQPVPTSWRGWLARGLQDDPSRTVSGWRSKIATDPELDDLWERTIRRIFELVDHCPERRDLIHGDLLHQNVLVSEAADEVTAVFSWKCSTWGDFLYDVAWLTFWGPWHPGIEAVDVWNRTLTGGLSPEDLHDAARRHHCYELHIGAQHLAWCSWTGDATSLAEVAEQTVRVLDRGPADS